MSSNVAALLRDLRPQLVEASVQMLASGVSLRASVSGEVERFYDLLEAAVESGHGEWIDPLINDWVRARSSETGIESTLLLVLNQLKSATLQIVGRSLPAEDAIDAIVTLEPIFDYAATKLTSMEIGAILAEAEAKLLEAQSDLERLDKSKSDFIAVAAHELKTPLTLIEGYANMLYSELKKADDARPNVLLRGIANGTRRLKEIIEDMVDVSMIDNKMLNLNYQPVQLQRMFEIAMTELEEALRERSLTFIIDEFEDDTRSTLADPERLYQVFMNVISNAIKFTPDGGTITVRARALPGFAEVIISDTGIGIAPENQTRIFEKFAQTGDVSLHSSGKTKFKGGGPGLGLAIARGIIEAHGGTIWCESPGYDEQTCPGSTFHIMVPIRERAPADHSAKLFTLTADELERLGQIGQRTVN